MKLVSLVVLIPLSLMSVSAIANVSEYEGKTQCTIIDSIAKKKITTSNCTYTRSIGGGNGYGIDNADYKLKNGKKYSTVNDATYDSGKDGRMINMQHDISLNDKPAKVSYINKKTFKVYNEDGFNKLREKQSPELANLWQCFSDVKTKDKAFCTTMFED